MENRKFKWLHNLSAPKFHPVRVYEGYLKGANEGDYTASFGLWMLIKSGWGRESGTVVSGPDLKAVPGSLHITWLSFTEDKFYTGRFQLPRERMIQLFEEGFYDYQLKEKETYTDILVGLAPGGLVVVWLLGGQVQTEVAHFQASETIIDPETATSENQSMFKRNYVQFILEDLGLEGQEVPFGLWEMYREKYSWRPKVVFPEGFRMAETWMTMYNGEKEHVFAEDPLHNEFLNRAVPANIMFMWYNAEGKLYYGKIFFDEAEIFNAYEALYASDKTQDAELIFELHDSQRDFTIYLRGATEQIELQKVRLKAYPSVDNK